MHREEREEKLGISNSDDGGLIIVGCFYLRVSGLGWIENQKCCFFPLSQMNLGSTHKNKKVLAEEFFSKMHRFLQICI